MALAGLIVVGTFACLAPARAQEIHDLVGNLNQGDTGETGYTTQRAQRFTTGPIEGGYVLRNIEFQRWTSFSPDVHVCAVDDDGLPTSPCTQLTARAVSFNDPTVVYDAPADTRLARNTTYTARVDNLSFRTIPWTTSDQEDDTSASGWSIANEWNYVERLPLFPGSLQLEDHWRTGSDGRSLRLVVRGRVYLIPNTAPTASNSSVTTAEDTAYTFSASDFSFSDADTGDTLASVRIKQVGAAVDLELDGTDVTEDQVITKADIDAGKLIFTPAANANGLFYASFSLSVAMKNRA